MTMPTGPGAVGLDEKVAFLRSRAAHTEAPRGVAVRETRMSWVFLMDASRPVWISRSFRCGARRQADEISDALAAAERAVRARVCSQPR